MGREIRNKKTLKDFQIEGKMKLKLKEIIREFREKNLFYLTHSKFATYIDPEYLGVFETEIVNFSKKWIRAFDQNMSAEKDPAIEGHGNTRGLHVMDTEQGAKDIGRELLLNEDLLRVGGKIHDFGHTSYAHDGEHLISAYLEEHGICEIHHATLARLVMEEEQVHEKVLERLAQKKGRELTKREISRYNKCKLIISDIAAAHNGEGSDYQVIANMDKTEQQIEDEFIATFTTPGADKKIVSKTPEGAVVRFNDPIAYVFKDFRDGVIGKEIDVNDPAYEEIFIRMGIPKEKLDEWSREPNKKDRIVREGTYLLRDNLTRNSKGINGAKMSKEMAELMYQLRQLNYERVVAPRTRQIIDNIGQNTATLITRYSDKLQEYESNEQSGDNMELNNYEKGMIKSLTKKQTQQTKKIYDKIARQGIKASVEREVDEVINGQNKHITLRRRRIEEDIERLKQTGEFSEEVKKKYIERLLQEINLSPKQSKNLLIDRLRREYPDATDEEIKKLEEKKQYLRLETYTECLAKLRTAIYIGESSNTYFLRLLESEGLITEQELKGRYISGGSTKHASILQTKEETRKAMESINDGDERE